MKRLILFFFCLTSLLSKSVFAQQSFVAREKIPLENWSFKQDSSATLAHDDSGTNWKAVTIPHSWNTQDVMDDSPGYYRNRGWYKIVLPRLDAYRNKQLLLTFEGTNQETWVFINGRQVAEHKGGYTGFSVAIQQFLNFDKENNEIWVCISNKFNRDIPPLTADFTFFGGLYRNVYLEVTDRKFFTDPKFGSKGLYYETPSVDEDQATIRIKGLIGSLNTKAEDIRIRTMLYDANGKRVSHAEHLERNVLQRDFNITLPPVSKPQLWSPEYPYLYRLCTQLIDKKGRVLDEITIPVGFRYFHFDAKSGFYLNGKPYKLIGASRHQDFKDLGNAVPNELQLKDLYYLKQMGGNFLRVAHYPQSPSIMQACDSLGILTSVEIPIVNEITESFAFEQNSLHMQQEMIKQNFNYCSVIIWAHMNEVLLRPAFNDDKTRQEVYFRAIYNLAKKLDSLTRHLDPFRYTMIAHHGNVDLYKRVGLTDVAMINGWNLYPGWYGEKIEDFGKQLDAIHEKMPETPFMVTEFGADADPRIHSFHPIRFDKSVEYALLYHKGYLDDFFKRPFVAGAFAWNLSDFSSETREESMPHINNKGLLTWDRKAKNTFYLYEAYLRKDPYLQLGTALWKTRGGIAVGTQDVVVQPLDVFSNQAEVALYVNGTDVGRKKVTQRSAVFQVPFRSGSNIIQAIAFDRENRQVSAQVDTIDFQLVDDSFKHVFDQKSAIHFSLGENRFVLDDQERLWIPLQQQPDQKWGAIGGEDYRLANRGGENVGTDRNIRNTFHDPVYQTQSVGIEHINIPLEDGHYKVVFHFAELSGGESKAALPYDLENPDAIQVQSQKRIFNVYVNGISFLSAFDIAREVGTLTALDKSTQIHIENNKGLNIRFEQIEGQAVLNALSIYRIK